MIHTLHAGASPAAISPDVAGGDALVVDTVDSPVGALTVIASASGLRAVLWPGERYDDRGRVRASHAGGLATVTHDPDDVMAMTVRQLGEYFDGRRRQFDVPLDPIGTPFQLDAWRVLREIPFGQTMTYGEQARALGDANKARAVGAANGKNPISIIVPCHRVVGGNGALTGFAGGLDAKSWLLGHERRIADRS
ncbi:MAG: methylated-DNA--[protein]-cysteine S-methyltransferase [Ilumatobacteraceae bacterium]